MLSACASGPSGLDLRPPIPDVDSELREPCRDPDVEINAEVAIALTREALAACEEKRAALVKQADLTRTGFGSKTKGVR